MCIMYWDMFYGVLCVNHNFNIVIRKHSIVLHTKQ